MDSVPEALGDVKVTTYERALASTKNVIRNLFLGNGFSMAARKRFAYGNIFDAAYLTAEMRALFDEQRTSNFEQILKLIADRKANAPAGPRRDHLERLYLGVKNSLADAIGRIHPPTINDLTDAEYKSCGKFLDDYVGTFRNRKYGKVFTVNYDLLLYWTTVKCNSRMGFPRLHSSDGFAEGWDRSKIKTSDIFYLHGALHIFPDGDRAVMLRYQQNPSANSDVPNMGYGIPLKKQILDRLLHNEYPLFVAEGDHDQKESQIAANVYLSTASRKFSDICRDRATALFIIGHGLGEQDRHLLDEIGRGAVENVFVGVHPKAGAAGWERVETIARTWRDQREGRPLTVHAFNSADCRIWRGRGGPTSPFTLEP